jgi:hypothetical protein
VEAHAQIVKIPKPLHQLWKLEVEPLEDCIISAKPKLSRGLFQVGNRTLKADCVQQSVLV